MRLVRSTYDPVTGFTEEFWYDDQTRRVTIRRLQDVEKTLADNRSAFNDHGRKNYAKSDGLHRVARIPFILLDKWLLEDGFDWFKSTDKERRSKLNHIDNRHLLVRPGRL